MKWFLKCFKQYADFSGRARRKEYWWFFLINFFIGTILSIIWTANIFSHAEDSSQMEVPMSIMSNVFTPTYFIILIYGLTILIPSIAVAVRRLHDIGRSGLWYLYMIIALFVFSFIMGMGSVSGDIMSIGMVIGIVGIIGVYIWMLIWFVKDSQYGENEWGPNPKGEGNPVEGEETSTIKENNQTL